MKRGMVLVCKIRPVFLNSVKMASRRPLSAKKPGASPMWPRMETILQAVVAKIACLRKFIVKPKGQFF